MKQYEVSFKVESKDEWRTYNEATFCKELYLSNGTNLRVPLDAEIKDVTPEPEIKAGDRVKDQYGIVWNVEHRHGDWLWVFQTGSNSGELKNVGLLTLVEEN